MKQVKNHKSVFVGNLLMLLDGVMYVKDGRKRYERDNS